MSATIHVIRRRPTGRIAPPNLKPAPLSPATEAALVAVIAALPPRKEPQL